METLINFDIYLFNLINGTLYLKALDRFFVMITTQSNWNITFIILGLWLLFKGGKTGRVAIFILAITILLSDQLSSSVLKPLIERVRPCHTMENIRLLVNCGAGMSFPSSHAVNNFAGAFILTYFYKNLRYVFYVIALLVAYSRVYVGVHYPADIVAGALIGTFVAFAVLLMYKFLKKKIPVFDCEK